MKGHPMAHLFLIVIAGFIVAGIWTSAAHLSQNLANTGVCLFVYGCAVVCVEALFGPRR